MKYNGKVKSATFDSYLKRKDKYHFAKVGKKYKGELKDFFISNFIHEDIWIGDMLGKECENNYKSYKKYIQSLTYSFRRDCEVLESSTEGLDTLFTCDNNTHPVISALETLNKNLPHTSYLMLDQLKTAYIIGNGQSRIGLDLDVLGGDVWGCNALFRDYTPDYLTIVDVSIMGECAESAYPKYNNCYFSGEWTEPLHRDEEYPVIKSTMDVPVREWIRPEHTHITM